jgi:hypothetical protein
MEGIPLQKEATGQGMDAAAKGILHVSTAFLGLALMQLAYTSAEERFCQDQYNVDDDGNNCSPTEDDLRVFGLRNLQRRGNSRSCSRTPYNWSPH